MPKQTRKAKVAAKNRSAAGRRKTPEPAKRPFLVWLHDVSRHHQLAVVIIVIFVGVAVYASLLASFSGKLSQDISSDPATTGQAINPDDGIDEIVTELYSLELSHSPVIEQLIFPYYESRQAEVPDTKDYITSDFSTYGDYEKNDESWSESISAKSFAVMLEQIDQLNPGVLGQTGYLGIYEERYTHRYEVELYDAEGVFVAREQVTINEYVDPDGVFENKLAISSIGYFYDQKDYIELSDGSRAVVITGLEAGEELVDGKAVLTAIRSPVGECGKYSGANEKCLIVTNNQYEDKVGWEVAAEFSGHFGSEDVLIRADDDTDVIGFYSFFADAGHGWLQYEGLNLRTGDQFIIFTHESEPVGFGHAIANKDKYDGLPAEIGVECNNIPENNARSEKISRLEASVKIITCTGYDPSQNPQPVKGTAFVMFGGKIVGRHKVDDFNSRESAFNVYAMENASQVNGVDFIFGIYEKKFRISLSNGELTEI